MQKYLEYVQFQSKPGFLLLLVLLVFTGTIGCRTLTAPDHFTGPEKVQFTTLKTLKSAKIFREFALESAGSVYKQGLMNEETKDKIISVGDELQRAINSAADALIAYKKSDGLGEDQSLRKRLLVYQVLFNQFMEIVTPYMMDSSKEEAS